MSIKDKITLVDIAPGILSTHYLISEDTDMPMRQGPSCEMQ